MVKAVANKLWNLETSLWIFINKVHGKGDSWLACKTLRQFVCHRMLGPLSLAYKRVQKVTSKVLKSEDLIWSRSLSPWGYKSSSGIILHKLGIMNIHELWLWNERVQGQWPVNAKLSAHKCVTCKGESRDNCNGAFSKCRIRGDVLLLSGDISDHYLVQVLTHVCFSLSLYKTLKTW